DNILPLQYHNLKVLGVFVTFHFVCFCWIFFKASSFEDARTILTQIFTNFNAAAWKPLLGAYGTVIAIMTLGYIIHFIPKSYEYFCESFLMRVSLPGRIAILLIFIWIIIQVKQADQVMPIYLQF
ncbi:MAG TPA: MBOAT family protein, partial [Bacteroidia bacterium]|nr:MBOAT family protein [Bacteroidia bacterium]